MEAITSADGTMVAVTFVWSTAHGACYECGLPAAFAIEQPGVEPDAVKRCAVCAANNAVDGERIIRLAGV